VKREEVTAKGRDGQQLNSVGRRSAKSLESSTGKITYSAETKKSRKREEWGAETEHEEGPPENQKHRGLVLTQAKR